jgi:hypothetical protein
MLEAARCLARYLRYGATFKGTRMKWALLGWVVVGIFPSIGRTADSLLGTTPPRAAERCSSSR